jgi:hypothetical protein
MYRLHPLVDQFNRLRKIKDPQGRGYKLQDFVGQLFRKRHFDVRLDSRAAWPRQTDLVARKGQDVYVVETKWKASPTDIGDLVSLRDRLKRTAGLAVGVFISMAPYTDTLINEVELKRKQPILLITRDEFIECLHYDEDIERLVLAKRDLLLLEGRAFAKRATPTSKASRGRLPDSSISFVLKDGVTAPYLALKGHYDHAVFALETFDIDWVTASGAGVTYDVSLPLGTEAEFIELLRYMAQVDWVTAKGQWALEQAGLTWHGFGARSLVRALKERRDRYASLERPHHTEVLCYHDFCDLGFYTIKADIEVGNRVARISSCDASFQLSGVPMDTRPFQQINSRFGVTQETYFRPRSQDSIEGGFVHLRVPLRPAAKIVHHDPRERAGEREWVVGLVVKNPLKGKHGLKTDTEPQLLHGAENWICRLGSWHFLHHRPSYRLRQMQWAWTSDVLVISPSADWDDKPRHKRT